MRSSFFERTHERWKNSASSVWEITDAIDVFPHPGGHQSIIEGTFPASMYFRNGFPTEKRCFCPIISSSDFGRRIDARGLMWDMGVIYDFLHCIYFFITPNNSNKQYSLIPLWVFVFHLQNRRVFIQFLYIFLISYEAFSSDVYRTFYRNVFKRRNRRIFSSCCQ